MTENPRSLLPPDKRAFWATMNRMTILALKDEFSHEEAWDKLWTWLESQAPERRKAIEAAPLFQPEEPE